MKVALCIISTGKYHVFLEPLLASVAQYFCVDHQVRVFVFADKFTDNTYGLDIEFKFLEHKPWPAPTLFRYDTILTARQELSEFDYVYYIDVDMLFVRHVADEIFGAITATIHFGFCDTPRPHFTYEVRKESTACIRYPSGTRYYAGGFQGGESGRYLKACKEMDANIQIDLHDGIIARWHDESHWNKYLADHPPDRTLSHEYCCPPQWRPETQRITIVGKNAAEMRS